MSPRDVAMAAALGGSLLGVAFMAFGALFLSDITNGGSSAAVYAYGGSALFVSGALFLLVSAVLVPVLWALRSERTTPP